MATTNASKKASKKRAAAGKSAAGTGGRADKKPTKAPGKTHGSKRAKPPKGAGRASAASGGNGRVAALPILSDTRRQVPCLSCALCCTYIAVEIDEPDTVRGATDVLWYLYHESVSVYVEDDEWMLQFETRCRNLGDDYKCTIYETRPQVCREFDEKGCEVNADTVGETLISPQQFLDYLRQHNKRIHTLVSKKYLPGEEHLLRAPSGKRRLPSFHERYATARALGAR